MELEPLGEMGVFVVRASLQARREAFGAERDRTSGGVAGDERRELRFVGVPRPARDTVDDRGRLEGEVSD